MAHCLGGGQGRNPFVLLIRASPPGPWSGWRLQEGGIWGKAGSPLLRPSRGRGTADWFGVSKDSDSTQKWQRKSIRHCSQRYGKLKPQVLRELDLPSQDNVSLASTETPPPLYVGPCQLGMQKVCPPLLPPTSPSFCPPGRGWGQSRPEHRRLRRARGVGGWSDGPSEVPKIPSGTRGRRRGQGPGTVPQGPSRDVRPCQDEEQCKGTIGEDRER